MKKTLSLFVLLAAICFVGGAITAPVFANDASEPQTVTCNSQAATIMGTDGDDEIMGTPGPDVIHGLGGSDKIFGNGGDDTICAGGTGNELYGNTGDDVIILSAEGANMIVGGRGVDTCFVFQGADFLCEEEILLVNGTEGEEDMSEEPPRTILIFPPELSHARTGATDGFKVNDPVVITTKVNKEGDLPFEGTIEYQITDPDNLLDIQITGGSLLAVQDTRTFEFEFVLEKPGTYTIVQTYFNEDNKALSGPTTLTVSTPVRQGTILIDNFRILDGASPRQEVTTTEVNQGVLFVFDAVNNTPNETPFFAEIVVSGTGNGTFELKDKTLTSFQERQIVFDFTPLKAGTYTATANIFDNPTDRNPLVAASTVTLTVTGEDSFTNDELRDRIVTLEAQIADLLLRIQALESAGRPSP